MRRNLAEAANRWCEDPFWDGWIWMLGNSWVVFVVATTGRMRNCKLNATSTSGWN